MRQSPARERVECACGLPPLSGAPAGPNADERPDAAGCANASESGAIQSLSSRRSRDLIRRSRGAMKRTWMLSVLVSVAAVADDVPPDYARDVRPLLQKHCYECHGPDKQKSGFRLDVRQLALKGGDSGVRPIIPHNARTSPLIRYVSGEDDEMLMPPKASGKPRLTPAEVDILKAWIEAGPAWPDEFAGEAKDLKPHWSLLPLNKPAVPPGSVNPVDAFIRATLASRQQSGAAPAERRTLHRRLT
jgi:mono/diheme cytochrome c family protein